MFSKAPSQTVQGSYISWKRDTYQNISEKLGRILSVPPVSYVYALWFLVVFVQDFFVFPVSDEGSAVRQPRLQSTFKRHTNRPRDEDPVLHHTAAVNRPDLIADECTSAVEADFEFLEHCDLDEEADLPINHQVSGQAEHTMTSYTESGMATLSKWLGYQ